MTISHSDQQPWRIGLASYKEWFDPAYFGGVMKQRYAVHGDIVLVHGATYKSVDMIAADWVRHNEGFTEDTYPKNFRKYGYAEDPEQAQRMVMSGMDELLVFIWTINDKIKKPRCKVAPYLINLAMDCDIPVIKYQRSRSRKDYGVVKAIRATKRAVPDR